MAIPKRACSGAFMGGKTPIAVEASLCIYTEHALSPTDGQMPAVPMVRGFAQHRLVLAQLA